MVFTLTWPDLLVYEYPTLMIHVNDLIQESPDFEVMELVLLLAKRSLIQVLFIHHPGHTLAVKVSPTILLLCCLCLVSDQLNPITKAFIADSLKTSFRIEQGEAIPLLTIRTGFLLLLVCFPVLI